MEHPRKEFDVVIVGAGPAGISAAIWCRELGLSVILLESEPMMGGQLWAIHNPIINYPGVSASSGDEFYQNLLGSAKKYELVCVTSVRVIKISTEEKCVMSANGEVFVYKALVIATGVSRRRLGVKGEETFQGRGIITSGSKERAAVKGRNVVIIGGGDAAIENALILSEYADRITIVHRGERLRARTEFTSKASKLSNVEIIFKTEVLEFTGTDNLNAVVLRHKETEDLNTVLTDLALVRVGVKPNIEIVPAEVDFDPNGYIMIDQYGRTSFEDIYAVGDVANPISPTIATAVGNGASVAKFIHSKIGEM